MASSTKLCKFCRKRISAKSVFCVNCQHFQNWRGGLAVSSTVLALLVALVSVLGTTIPAVKAALTPKNSDLRFSIQTVGQQGLSAFISNAGIRPGTVQPGVHLRITESNGNIRNAMLTGFVRDQEVVKPGASLLRRYELIPLHFRRIITDEESYTEVDDTMIRSGKEQSCVVRFYMTDFLGTSKEVRVPFDCSQKLPGTKLPILEPSQN